MATNVMAAEVTANVDVQKSIVKWEGSSVVGKVHNGTVKVKQGELILNENVPIGGSFIIDMQSISSDDLTGEMKAMLEKHLKSADFFSVDTFPTAKLVATKVTLKSGKIYSITGNLTIKEKTNPITFDAAIDIEGNTIKAKSLEKIVLDRTLWEVKYGSSSFFKGLADKAIKDEMVFDVSIEAELK